MHSLLHRRNEIPKVERFLPEIVMVYTDLQKLRGLDTPTDYGSGIEYADGILVDDRIRGLQIGLWLNGTEGCRDIVSGRLQSNIQRLIHYLEHARVEIVFLRVGYEFDNPLFRYNDPEAYVHAYQHLVQQCRHRAVCREKVAFVWHSWAAGLPPNTSLQDYYPGDEYVDWIGVSVFSQVYPNSSSGGNHDTLVSLMRFARIHDKPVMIAESTPFGGIDHFSDPWNAWFEPVLDLIVEYDISLWSYIDCDWDSQPMWRNVGFGDSRLSINTTVLSLWQERVLSSPRFHRHGQWSIATASSSSSALMEDTMNTMLSYIPIPVPMIVFVILLSFVLMLRLCTGVLEELSYGYAPVETDVVQEVQRERNGYGSTIGS